MATSSINQTRDNDHHDDHYDHYEKSEDDLALLIWDEAKLIAQGVSIEIKARWWGYTIEMNANAVEFLDNCLDYLMSKFEKHFKETKLRRAISLCIQFKRMRLVNAVDRSNDGFVRMVSPWVIPFALVVVRGGTRQDQNLWYTVWDNEKKLWGEDAEFNDGMTRNAPALVQHGDFLYCVHRGSDGDDRLWWMVYSTDKGWSNDIVFPTIDGSKNHRTELNPSLVVFQNTLYCFHRGTGNDHFLYYCTFDTESNDWNDDELFHLESRYFETDYGCGVAVFKKNLHLVYQVASHNYFHHIYFDGTKWYSNNLEPQGYTADIPGLVNYNDKLIMVHRGHNNEDLWYDTYDGIGGTGWKGDQKIENACSQYGPGLAVFDNKVFMAHRGANSDKNIWYSTYTDDNGGSWTQDTMANRDNGIWTGAPPALACYKDPQCTANNYEDLVLEDNKTVVQTYVPRLICVHRGYA
jgi:hypothetical protein